MSTIVEFFTAPDDKAATTILDHGPDGTFETVQVGNFDAISAIEEWDRALTGRAAEDLGRDDVPRVIAGDSPFVIAVSGAFQQALAAAGRAELAATVHRWIDAEELHGYDPELFTDILGEIAELAANAGKQGHTLYCWMC